MWGTGPEEAPGNAGERGEGRASEWESRAGRWCHKVQTGEPRWGTRCVTGPGRSVRPVAGLQAAFLVGEYLFAMLLPRHGTSTAQARPGLAWPGR